MQYSTLAKIGIINCFETACTSGALRKADLFVLLPIRLLTTWMAIIDLVAARAYLGGILPTNGTRRRFICVSGSRHDANDDAMQESSFDKTINGWFCSAKNIFIGATKPMRACWLCEWMREIFFPGFRAWISGRRTDEMLIYLYSYYQPYYCMVLPTRMVIPFTVCQPGW